MNMRVSGVHGIFVFSLFFLDEKNRVGFSCRILTHPMRLTHLFPIQIENKTKKLPCKLFSFTSFEYPKINLFSTFVWFVFGLFTCTECKAFGKNWVNKWTLAEQGRRHRPSTSSWPLENPSNQLRSEKYSLLMDNIVILFVYNQQPDELSYYQVFFSPENPGIWWSGAKVTHTIGEYRRGFDRGDSCLSLFMSGEQMMQTTNCCKIFL